MTGLFYWNQQPNWGDKLSPLLVEHFTYHSVHWASPQTADLISVGSILDVMPSEWDGIVAGSGILSAHQSLDHLYLAEFLGVRGELTRQRIPTTDVPVLGDPALLADELVNSDPIREPVFDLGIVPHWTDHELVPRFIHLAKDHQVVVIPATTPPLDAIERIGSCKKIVSSSLHGIIVADAFGIPRRAERFPAMFNKYEGGEFKFHDHASAIRLPMRFGQVQTASRERVEELQVGLFQMFTQLREALS